MQRADKSEILARSLLRNSSNATISVPRSKSAELVRWTDTLPRLKGTDLVRDANGIAYLRVLLELRR